MAIPKEVALYLDEIDAAVSGLKTCIVQAFDDERAQAAAEMKRVEEEAARAKQEARELREELGRLRAAAEMRRVEEEAERTKQEARELPEELGGFRWQQAAPTDHRSTSGGAGQKSKSSSGGGQDRNWKCAGHHDGRRDQGSDREHNRDDRHQGSDRDRGGRAHDKGRDQRDSSTPHGASHYNNDSSRKRSRSQRRPWRENAKPSDPPHQPHQPHEQWGREGYERQQGGRPDQKQAANRGDREHERPHPWQREPSASRSRGRSPFVRGHYLRGHSQKQTPERTMSLVNVGSIESTLSDQNMCWNLGSTSDRRYDTGLAEVEACS